MLTTTDVARIYDTVLSIPGMNDHVKIDLKISRKNILLLSIVIERGLIVKEDDKSQSLLSSVSKETLQQLKDFAGECLQKAGLVELHEKLHGLNAGKG